MFGEPGAGGSAAQREDQPAQHRVRSRCGGRSWWARRRPPSPTSQRHARLAHLLRSIAPALGLFRCVAKVLLLLACHGNLPVLPPPPSRLQLRRRYGCGHRLRRHRHAGSNSAAGAAGQVSGAAGGWGRALLGPTPVPLLLERSCSMLLFVGKSQSMMGWRWSPTVWATDAGWDY
jgi:hypothetical protein